MGTLGRTGHPTNLIVRRQLGVLILAFVLVGCNPFGTVQPETPAERLATLEISSQEIDKRIIELVDTGVIKGETAARVHAAGLAFDAALDSARLAVRTGTNMDPSVTAAQAALSALSAILTAIQKEGSG